MSLGVLCPGQGGQNPAMLDLIAGDPAAEAILALAAPALGREVRELLTRPPDEFFENRIAQPLLCAVEMATWAAIAPGLPPPRAFAGYSLGEFAAYGCAGAIVPANLLEIVRRRAEAMDDAWPEPSRLCAVRGLNRTAVTRLAEGYGVFVAIVNGPDRFVMGGRAAAMEDFEAAANRQGGAITQLPVTVAAHTPLMGTAIEPIRAALCASSLAAPPVPVLAGLDGTPVLQRQRAIDTLSRQAAQTIDWAACLEGLREAGCRVLIELGPGDALARMAREQLPDLPCRSTADFRTLEGVASWVRRYIA